MKLLIAIPALNEEESIDSIIRRSIEAREFIRANSPATDVAITVVSDGSTDRTVERASRYTDSIHLIVFPLNTRLRCRHQRGLEPVRCGSAGFPRCRRNLRSEVLCDPMHYRGG